MERHLLLFFVLLTALFNSCHAVFRGHCTRKAVFRLTHENYRLSGYVISTQDVLSSLDCQLACLRENQCRSYNFGVSGHPLHKCELNRKTQNSTRPDSFQLADGYEYHEIVEDLEASVPCGTNPCVNDGVCEHKCVGYPYYRCRCPKGLGGKHCEKLQHGDFVIKYNGNTSNVERVPVLGPQRYIRWLTICVWVKPKKTEGYVFTYATTENLMEFALYFSATKLQFYLSDKIINITLAIPLGKWSHLCFSKSEAKFRFIYNGFDVYNDVKNISEKFGIPSDGYLVLGANQTAPGNIDYDSVYDSDFCGFQWWNTWLTKQTFLHLYNQPYFSDVVTRWHLLDWRDFYDPIMPFNKTVEYPSDELLSLDKFHLVFSGQEQPVNISVPTMVGNVSEFTLNMWLTSKMERSVESTVLRVRSASEIMMELVVSGTEVKFTLDKFTWSFPFISRKKEWYSVCITWKSKSSVIRLFADGLNTVGRDNNKRETVQIVNGSVEIGGDNFVGNITRVNIWSNGFDGHMAGIMGIEPGRAQGDLFSWESAKDQNNAVNDQLMTEEYRETFDIIFPPQGTGHYIILKSPHTLHDQCTKVQISFWIKIPRNFQPFTIISFATRSQLYELNIHFGTDGIWVHVAGEKRLKPFDYKKVYGTWNQFVFRFNGENRELDVWLNLGSPGTIDGLKSETMDWSDGSLVIGHQQIYYGAVCTKEYQFRGEISQLNIWGDAINYEVMRALAGRCTSSPGDIMPWSDIPTGEIHGDVQVRNASECLAAVHGEKIKN